MYRSRGQPTSLAESRSEAADELTGRLPLIAIHSALASFVDHPHLPQQTPKVPTILLFRQHLVERFLVNQAKTIFVGEAARSA